MTVRFNARLACRSRIVVYCECKYGGFSGSASVEVSNMCTK